MSLLLDAIILFFVICIVWSAARRGFVRAFMNLLSSFASLTVAYAFTPRLGEFIREKFVLSPITDDIFVSLKGWTKEIHALQHEGEVIYNFDFLLENKKDELTSILNRYRINVDTFIDRVTGLTNCPEDTIHGFAEEIATPVSSVISAALAFIIIFIGVSIVLKLITELLDYIFMLPVLKSANTVLGIVFGVIEGAAVACVLAMALSNLVQIIGAIDPNLFGADVLDNTLICKHLDNFEIFSKVREVLG